MTPNIRPKLADIARDAGLSTAAVSMALRNHPSIPAPTRDRVREIADRMGYRPNPLVSALMSQLQTGREERNISRIAIVDAWPLEVGWKAYPLFAQQAEGMRKRAHALGYEVEEFRLKEHGMNPKRLSKVLAARGIAGVIIPPMPKGLSRLHLAWEHFASVAVNYSLIRPELHRAAFDTYQTTWQAFRALHRLGYRRLGIALTAEDNQRSLSHDLGAFSAFSFRLAENNRVPPHLCGLPERQRFLTWLRTYRPDVLLSYRWEFREWVEEAGLRTPEDIGYACLASAKPHYAGIDQNGAGVGAAAIDLLVAQLHRNEHGIPAQATTLLVEGRWVPGPTVRQVGAPSEPAASASRSSAKSAAKSRKDIGVR